MTSGNTSFQHASSLDLKTSADGESTTKAGSLFHGQTIPTEKAAFLWFSRKRLWCNRLVTGVHIQVLMVTPVTLLPLYSTLVRHRLEYAIQASSGYLKKDINPLNCLQPLACTMVKDCRANFVGKDWKNSIFRSHVHIACIRTIHAYSLSNGSLDLPLENFFNWKTMLELSRT